MAYIKNYVNGLENITCVQLEFVPKEMNGTFLLLYIEANNGNNSRGRALENIRAIRYTRRGGNKTIILNRFDVFIKKCKGLSIFNQLPQ